MTVITYRQAGPFEYDDLEDEPCDGYRREIIGGVLIVTPAPNFGHQLASSRLHMALSAAQPQEMVTLAAPFDWRHPDGGVVEPDLLVMWKKDADRHGPLGPDARPLLVVEILSPSNRAYDQAMKRELYERLGVPSYWIVDPDRPSLLALRLAEGLYRSEAEFSGTDEFSTDAPFPLRFRIADLSALD